MVKNRSRTVQFVKTSIQKSPLRKCPLGCQFCYDSSKISVAAHIRNVHPDIWQLPDKMLRIHNLQACPYCNLYFDKRNGIKIHTFKCGKASDNANVMKRKDLCTTTIDASSSNNKTNSNNTSELSNNSSKSEKLKPPFSNANGQFRNREVNSNCQLRQYRLAIHLWHGWNKQTRKCSLQIT